MSGKVYFITGGNRGIGYELVKQLAESDPTNLIITSTRNYGNSIKLLTLIQRLKNIKVVTLDVADEGSINLLPVQLTQFAPNGIDVFISNAGLVDLKAYAPVIEVPKEQWINHYTTNVLGPILLTQKILPLMNNRDTKQLIFITSSLGSIGMFIPVSSSAYGQSKAALDYTIRGLSLELGPKGFTVVAVHPGIVNTVNGEEGIKLLAYNHPEVIGDPKKRSISPEESASKQIDLFKTITKDSNGTFLSYTGESVPW